MEIIGILQAYMSSVFDVADGAVVEARRIGPVISEATTIINRDVNTTDILASIAVRHKLPPGTEANISP